jgi:hypothetical protein
MTAFGGALTDPTKIMGSRIGAYVIDSLLAVAVVVGMFFILDAGSFQTTQLESPAAAQARCQEIQSQTNGPGQPRIVCVATGSTVRTLSESELAAAEIHARVAAIGFGFFNYVILTAITGATFGKLLFGLRVVTANGRRAGIGRNLVRWAFLIIDAACCFLPGLLTSFNSKGHRRVGDMVAGTFVVHRSAEGRLLSIPGLLVVRNRHDDPYGPAPIASPAAPGGGGIDGPVFDPARNTYVRYDQTSGAWFQWDDVASAWVPIR